MVINHILAIYRLAPRGDTCKLYVDVHNMVIVHIMYIYGLALRWTALPDSPTKVPHRVPGAHRNRMGDSRAPSQRY